MRIPAVRVANCVLLVILCGCSSAPAPPSSSNASPDAPTTRPAPASSAAEATASLAGFAFVDSSVTGQGSRAKLPPGTKIYPSGSTITGTDGCPTNRYRTDGQIVLVIDYTGRPTAASVAVVRHPASGGEFADAAYYIDLDSGRTLQFLGPIFDNGNYDVHFSYSFNTGQQKKMSATFVLARSCS
jgi:hypothetical protein